MKRTSSSGPPRGEGPRRAGKWDSRPSPRARDERGPRGGDARPGARGSGAVPAARPSPRAADPERLLGRQPWAALRPLIPGDDAEVESRLLALRGYARQLLEWNRGVSNLISRHDEPRIVERHLRESLLPARAIAAAGARRFVDFGSGAGLPAIPLALCGIGDHWTLVESRRNKTLFLRKVQQDNKLKHIDVRTGRLEVLVEEQLAELSCDAFTSRATASVGPTLQLAGRIVVPGGRAFLWKGSSFQQEMDASQASWASGWQLERVTQLADGLNVVVVFIRQ